MTLNDEDRLWRDQTIPKVSDDDLEKIIKTFSDNGNGKEQVEEYGNLTHEQFEKELIKKYHFKATKDNEDLYYYDPKNGIYVRGGQWVIRQECFKFNPEITTKQVDQIIAHIIWGNYVDREIFDSNIEWLVCKNVTVNLLSGEAREHSPEFMAITQIPHLYTFFAVPTPWKILEFLHQVMDYDDVETVLDFMAYCLWRGFPYHRWLLLNGSGRNGKGVTTELITRLLGKKNVSNETLHRILDRTFSIANLYGKMANIDADLSSKGLKETGMLKKLTGGDAIQGEFKFKTPFSFKNYAKLIFAVNEMPVTPDETDAFFARPLIINFPNQYLGEKANPNLINELSIDAEMSAFLRLLMARVPRILKDGIKNAESHTIEHNYEKYMRNSNPIRSFAETVLELDNHSDANVTINDMYEAYIDFCDYYKLSKVIGYTFSRDLGRLGFKKKQIRVGKVNTKDRPWAWLNVKIIKDWKNPDFDSDPKNEDEDLGGGILDF